MRPQIPSRVALPPVSGGLTMQSPEWSIHLNAFVVMPYTIASCNMAFSRALSEMCGAGNFLSVYSTGNLTVYQALRAHKVW